MYQGSLILVNQFANRVEDMDGFEGEGVGVPYFEDFWLLTYSYE